MKIKKIALLLMASSPLYLVSMQLAAAQDKKDTPTIQKLITYEDESEENTLKMLSELASNANIIGGVHSVGIDYRFNYDYVIDMDAWEKHSLQIKNTDVISDNLTSGLELTGMNTILDNVNVNITRATNPDNAGSRNDGILILDYLYGEKDNPTLQRKSTSRLNAVTVDLLSHHSRGIIVSNNNYHTPNKVNAVINNTLIKMSKGNNQIGLKVWHGDVKSNNLNIIMHEHAGVGIDAGLNSIVELNNAQIRINPFKKWSSAFMLGADSARRGNYTQEGNSVITLNDSLVDAENNIAFRYQGEAQKIALNNSTIKSRDLIKYQPSKGYLGKASIALTAENNTSLSGVVNTENNTTTEMALSSGSTWNVTGDSNLTHLKTDKANVVLLKDKDQYIIADVDVLSGQQGTYLFAVDIAQQAGSKLIINQSSEGTHFAQGVNDGAQNTTGQEKVTIIEDNSDSQANATFKSSQDIELGGYTYQVQRDSENRNNWVLAAKVNDETPITPVTPKPTINDTARTITGLASTAYLLNQAEMATLRQRMGDLTLSTGTAVSGDVSGLWGRVYGGNYKTNDNHNLAKADMNYYGFQLGGDWNTLHANDNKNYVGLFLGHTTGKPDYARGDATATSWYGGFYDTFIMDNGFYADAVVKFGQYRNKYDLKDNNDLAIDGKGQSNILTLSAEIGKRMMLAENETYTIYLEPQAQLLYSRIGSFNTTASNGLRVSQDAYNSTISRLGALLGTQINKRSDVYLKTSYLHEFTKDVDYKLNTSAEEYNLRGDGIEVGLGTNIDLNNYGYLYMEANYVNSKSHYSGSKFNIGYRYSF